MRVADQVEGARALRRSEAPLQKVRLGTCVIAMMALLPCPSPVAGRGEIAKSVRHERVVGRAPRKSLSSEDEHCRQRGYVEERKRAHDRRPSGQERRPGRTPKRALPCVIGTSGKQE